MSKHVRTTVRCNKIQLERLISFMANNRDLARGLCLDKVSERQRWENLQRELAKLGHPRTVEQWKITWRDLTKRARMSLLTPDAGNHISKTTPNVNAQQNASFLRDKDKRVLSIIGEILPENSDDNTTEAQEIAVQESPPVMLCGYQDIMALLPEREVGNTDEIQIEISDDCSMHPKCSNIKTEVAEYNSTEERDDPLSNSSHGGADDFEDVELEEANEEEIERLDDNYFIEQESDKEVNNVDHRHYTARPRKRRIKLPTSTDELKRMYLRKKIQNACLEREKLLLEISQAKQRHKLEMSILISQTKQKHEFEMSILKKQLNKYS